LLARLLVRDGARQRTRINDRASLEGAEQRWQNPKYPDEPGRLKAYFGRLKASQVTTELLRKYVLKCQSDGLANPTINRDLAALKRAFKLALPQQTAQGRRGASVPSPERSDTSQGFC
jgi:hypothetical protein